MPVHPILLAKLEDPSVAEIGGKAASLVRLARAGLRVPVGAVLPTSWFSEWWAELEGTDACVAPVLSMKYLTPLVGSR